MNQLIMKIVNGAADGAAIGIREFLKHSLTITVLMCLVAGLTWTIFAVDAHHKVALSEIKAEVLQMRKDYADQITELRRDVIDCNEARQRQAIQIIELQYLLKQLKH